MRDKIITPRKGCVDVWNAFMVKGAHFTLGSDFPILPRTAEEIPENLLSFSKAKTIHNRRIKDNPDYHENAFIHFYYDDQKFDGPISGVWKDPYSVLEIVRHFSGAISPDFSTYADFPYPIKKVNFYKMRAYDVWFYNNKIPVIPNVRWGTQETWNYCFDGIPFHGIVAIGTVASGIDELINRPLFEEGLYRMVDILNPHTIIVYGSANYKFIKDLEIAGIKIISFKSETNQAFETKKGGKKHEQA